MRVSVAMATHNGAAYVAEQLRSILAQTRPIDELIVSDDASTDATASIVHATVVAHHAAGYAGPAFVWQRNERALGVTANFEQALAACTGDLLALSDQDDVWHPERIERQEARFERDAGLLLTASNARTVDAAGQPLGYDHFTALEVSAAERAAFARGEPVRALFRRNVVTGATVMMRRSLLDAARPFPPAWLHDEWLAMIGAASGRIELVDDCLIDYRQHGRNQVGMLQLTLADKVGRFLEPRTERNRRLRDRARALAERLANMPGISEEMRVRARDKARFEEQRFAMPANRLARIPAILPHVLNGDYRRFGTGLRDAVRNLIQPV